MDRRERERERELPRVNRWHNAGSLPIDKYTFARPSFDARTLVRRSSPGVHTSSCWGKLRSSQIDHDASGVTCMHGK